MAAAKVSSAEIEGYGTVLLQQNIEGRITILELQDVAYMPSIRSNLVSLSKAQEAGVAIEYPPATTKMIAKYNGQVIMVCSRKERILFELSGMRASKSDESDAVMFSAGKGDDIKLMHRRTCRTGTKTLEKMVRLEASDGLDILKTQKTDFDIGNECSAGQATAVPHKRKDKQKRAVLKLLHMDVMGPMTPIALSGELYCMEVLDDASGAVWIKRMKKKSDVPHSVKSIINVTENKTGKRAIGVRSDRAKEYMSKELIDCYLEKGIEHEPTPPYSPESMDVLSA